jgi:hypothetical protein
MRALVMHGAPYESTRVIVSHLVDGLCATRWPTTAGLIVQNNALVVGGPI